jgi:hypothetical protein
MLAFAAGPTFADDEAASHGLVPLPCRGTPLHPVAQVYCGGHRHYVTPDARDALIEAAAGLARAFPGSSVQFMEASWPSALRPMPPHFSHGDGREVDLALFYEDRDGRPRPGPPILSGQPNGPGYGAYEPPQREADRVCVGVRRGQPDPAADRSWRLDEARTRDLIRRLVADPRVRRVFLEPHLKARLGFAREPKVRFAGCAAARHDDHIHVDFR